MLLTESELRRWGEAIGRAVRTPAFICLYGELGAGKSVLARAVARGAGVEGPIPSPTFNLLFRYDASHGVQVVHMDLYRLDDPEEVWELGWEELGAPDQVVLVEWPEKAGAHLPDHRWEITLRSVDGEPLLRRVSVRRVGHPHEIPSFPLTLDAGGGPP